MAQGTTTKVKKRKKSVLKRATQSIKRAAVNRANRTHVRSMIKSLRGVGSGATPQRPGKLAAADDFGH